MREIPVREVHVRGIHAREVPGSRVLVNKIPGGRLGGPQGRFMDKQLIQSCLLRQLFFMAKVQQVISFLKLSYSVF
ncbi:hypothetical protein SDC9_59045 [bioreactor metagenome]|uniref:Uncharacterized protein n=1 Tax=bioreactor metagenome TaxID=1076179 RepID=A0A644XA53_9ZZZZ